MQTVADDCGHPGGEREVNSVAVAQRSHEGYASTVRVSDFDVELDGDFVRVLRDGVEVARCGWTGRRIVPPTGPRGVAPVIDWQAIESVRGSGSKRSAMAASPLQ